MFVTQDVVELTQAFYEWERRGRGWQSFDEPVRLEPAFAPFRTYAPEVEMVDDGRKLTWWQKLAARWRDQERPGSSGADARELAPESDELVPDSEARERAWREFEVLVPPEAGVDEKLTAGWLASLSTCRGPVAFELLGEHGQVSVRLACDQADVGLVTNQFRAFFPTAYCRQAEDLAIRWRDTPGPACGVIDFGLAREFMIPLKTNWPGLDALTPLIGSLAHLRVAEIGVIQILFQPVRAPWAGAMMQAVTTPGGEPFFADAPEVTELAQAKAATPLYAVALRIGAQSEDDEGLWNALRRMAGGLALLGGPHRNELVPLAMGDGDSVDDLLHRTTHRSGMIWSLAELACLVHPPDKSVGVAGLLRVPEPAETAPAEVLVSEGLSLGETSHRGKPETARLPVEMRLKHVHVVGASGTGKSTLLVRMILQDIEAGCGVGLIDPHGDLADEVLSRLPANRLDQVIVLDPADEDYVVGWNILQAHSASEKDMLASDLVAAFRRLSTSWGDQMTTVMSNAVLAFLESSRGGTLVDLRRFLVDDEFREQFLRTVRDPGVVGFWQQEFALLIGKKPQAPILTRLDTFLRSRLVRDSVVEEAKPLDFRRVVDEGLVFIGRLSQGAIGQENAALLGTLLVSKFHQVCLGRQDQAMSKRRPFFLYVDEFQEVATPSMAALFSGVRKYHLGLTVAHQDLYQLHARAPEVERAVLANAYTRICFRVAEEDARRLERGLGRFAADDLMNLRTGEAICRVGRKEDDFRLRTRRLETVAEASDRVFHFRRQSFDRYGRRRGPISVPTVPVSPDEPSVAAGPGAEAGAAVTEPPPMVTTVVGRPLRPTRPRRAAEPSLPGRGGAEHKYLQGLIREWGQQRGFRVVIEETLPDGGRVDVGLTSDDLKLACEVALTTSVEHELANIEKCLAAGFHQVLVISLKRPHLAKLRAAVGDRFDGRVQFLTPEEVLGFLDAVVPTAGAERVAGYAVRVKRKAVGQTDAQAKKLALAGIIGRSMKRLKSRS